jgi:hypothetical protein
VSDNFSGSPVGKKFFGGSPGSKDVQARAKKGLRRQVTAGLQQVRAQLQQGQGRGRGQANHRALKVGPRWTSLARGISSASNSESKVSFGNEIREEPVQQMPEIVEEQPENGDIRQAPAKIMVKTDGDREVTEAVNNVLTLPQPVSPGAGVASIQDKESILQVLPLMEGGKEEKIKNAETIPFHAAFTLQEADISQVAGSFVSQTDDTPQSSDIPQAAEISGRRSADIPQAAAISGTPTADIPHSADISQAADNTRTADMFQPSSNPSAEICLENVSIGKKSSHHKKQYEKSLKKCKNYDGAKGPDPYMGLNVSKHDDREHGDRNKNREAEESKEGNKRRGDARSKDGIKTSKEETKSDRIAARPTVIDLYSSSPDALEDIPGIDDELAQTIVSSVRIAASSYSRFITRYRDWLMDEFTAVGALYI